ncbi:UDP-N-acetyl-D-glucosamine dehydrogenase [Bacillus thuringiensis]|uniref:UDP-N-acetyl-D-glucosamine dehydrogenase n=1 Tax=Bacillus thuringiensis TaxID=1428 RepID=A0A9X7GGA7_BACTU|nr:nucleotide sugar dehydrogenase [Bacillus thuringiensis]PGH78262.1 UDP-N-acetyl-D-glucosamine dehydrogenase [Bacillus thuringiensis]
MIQSLHQSFSHQLNEKLQKKVARIGIMGLGYVGLPTACYYAEQGYNVTGFEISSEKVGKLNQGLDYKNSVNPQRLEKILRDHSFIATTDMKQLREMDVIFICVPTPITLEKNPDLTYVKDAGLKVAKYVANGTLIILESTTYPGTTEAYIVQPLVERGFIVGDTIFVAYSPERIDPGNIEFDLKNTPKVVGGMTQTCTELASRCIGDTAHPVSGVQTAELSKVFENTFRWVNIGLVNELAVLCHELKIDVWETIQAAASKPYGFMKFTPGIGVGGHCIPVDPYYLTYKAKEKGKRTKFIDVAGEINEGMVQYVYIRILELLAKHNTFIKQSHVVILGASYKPNIGDLRESPVINLVEYLQGKSKHLTIIDPYVDELFIHGKIQPIKAYESSLIQKADIVIIGTPHDCFEWEDIYKHSKLIFDSKNIMKQKGYCASFIETL